MADCREDEFVCLFETDDSLQMSMLKGLMEDAGIPFVVEGEIATLMQSVDGLLRKSLRMRVPSAHEARSRDLLRSFLQPASPPGRV
jgi:hypothetical protein